MNPTESDHGYVYVLINPQMEGLVKIGKTTRTPQERAKEISNATGVPSPFIVVYESFFENCSKAEIFVHNYLESKELRLSKNREFFEISIKQGIDSIIEAKNHFGEFSLSNTNEDIEELDNHNNSENTSEEFHLLANKYYYGEDEELQDYEEAMKYYLIAIKLGSSISHRQIGLMYLSGEGVKENVQKALHFFKEGVKNNDLHCYINMADCYHKEGNVANASKCWTKFFSAFDELFYKNNSELSQNQVVYEDIKNKQLAPECLFYLMQNQTILPEHFEKLHAIRHYIVKCCIEFEVIDLEYIALNELFDEIPEEYIFIIEGLVGNYNFETHTGMIICDNNDYVTFEINDFTNLKSESELNNTLYVKVEYFKEFKKAFKVTIKQK